MHFINDTLQKSYWTDQKKITNWIRHSQIKFCGVVKRRPQNQKDCQCMCKLTLTRVRVTIVAVEEH